MSAKWAKQVIDEARERGLGLVKITLKGAHIEGHGITSHRAFACDEVAFQALDDLVRDIDSLKVFEAQGRWISLSRTDAEGRPLLCCRSCGRTRTVSEGEECIRSDIDCDEWEPDNAYR